MHASGICKPHSATTLLHLLASDTPALSLLLSVPFQEVPPYSEQLCKVSFKPRSIGFGDPYILFYVLFLTSHLNWGFQ